MGKDSPDGMFSSSDLSRSDLIQQSFRHFQYNDDPSIDPSSFHDVEYVHSDPYHIIKIQGFRVLNLDDVPFYVYMWYGDIEIGNYYVPNQLEVFFVNMDNYLLDVGDTFGGRIVNPAAGGHTFHMYIFGKEYLKPAGWVHRPVSVFTVDDLAPSVDQVVAFTDASLYSPTSWFWDFGDGSYSVLQNPTHVYKAVGRYTVTLNVLNAGGSDISYDVVVVEF